MNRSLIRIALVGALALTATLGVASAARANHHLIMVREVHRGTTGAQDDYVLLQMFADGQNVNLGTHYIDILNTNGQADAEYPLPQVPNGLNQRTILIGNMNVPGADFNNAGVAIPDNGAVCYDETNGYDGTGGLDCIAWGNFLGDVHPLSSPGLPTVLGGMGLAPGQTLVRTISRGCPTLLDAPDDTNSSNADFALGAATPRNNAATPTEKPCTTGTGSTGTAAKKKCKKKKKHSAESAKKKKCKKKKKH
jgi:hypothetical protein